MATAENTDPEVSGGEYVPQAARVYKNSHFVTYRLVLATSSRVFSVFLWETVSAVNCAKQHDITETAITTNARGLWRQPRVI